MFSILRWVPCRRLSGEIITETEWVGETEWILDYIIRLMIEFNGCMAAGCEGLGPDAGGPQRSGARSSPIVADECFSADRPKK